MQRRYSVLVSTVTIALALFDAGLRAQSAGSASPGGSTIAGKVMDPRGGPVEGATVTLYQMIYSEAAGSSEPKVVDEKSTGPDGTFTLTIPPIVDLYRITYIVARKKGLSLGWASWQAPSGRPLELVLGEAKELAGEVVDEKGVPVADAEVRIIAVAMERGQERRYPPAPDFLRAKTDGNGRFVFLDMPAEATFDFTAGKPGLATISTLERSPSARDRYQFSPGQPGIKLVLPPEARVEGVVMDKAGQPVGGAWVTAVPVGRPGKPPSPRPAPTAPDGAFRIGGLGAGDYGMRVMASAGPMVPWAGEPVDVSLQAGETKRDIKLQMTKGGLIEVRVQDTAGRPVAGALASVRDVQSDRGSGSVTDANGLAQVRVMPGQYTSSGPRKEGYTQPVPQRLEQIAIADGETKRIEFVLSAVPAITGIVRDEAGNPLAGVKFHALPMLTMVREITSDASGRFTMVLEPRMIGPQDGTFILVARDVARNLAEAVDLDQPSGALDLKLKPGLIVTGAVLGEEGRPLPGARIRVSMRGSRWVAPLGRGDLATAGPDGRFEIRALPPEREGTVSAGAEGYGRREVSIDPGQAKGNRFDAGQFKLVRATLSITGVVVDPNDKPVAGANLYALGEGQPDPHTIQTDAEGRFTIKGVCPGAIRLQVSSRGRPPMYGSAQAEGGATDLWIVISPRPTGSAYMPRRPTTLKGGPLPSLKDVGVYLPADAAGRMLLVCFWDMGQRPSRSCLTQLAARAAQLREKGVGIVAVHAAKVEGGALSQWIEKNKIPFKTGITTADIDKTRSAWGVASLPHLILTDRKHMVVAEGFGLGDLDKQIEAAAGQ